MNICNLYYIPLFSSYCFLQVTNIIILEIVRTKKCLVIAKYFTSEIVKLILYYFFPPSK